MACGDWLTALLIAGALGRMGALPATVPLDSRVAYVQQGTPLRIGIAQNAQTVRVVAGRGAAVTVDTASGRSSLRLSAGQPLWARASAGVIVVEVDGTETRCDRVTVNPTGPMHVSSSGAASRSGAYPGQLEILLDPAGTLTAVNIVPLERYLEGVVAAEMPLSFHPEALKAQAIIARSYALFHIGRHAEQGFDLCDGVHCQAYRGDAAAQRAVSAVRATAGKVVAYRGCLADTVYHSTCGGFVDDAHRVWPGYLLPYLRARPDAPGRRSAAIASDAQAARFIGRRSGAYCSRSSRYRWTRSYRRDEVQRLLEANLPLVTTSEQRPGALLGVWTEGRSPGGRLQTLRIITVGAEFEVKRNDIRWLFGIGEPGPGGLPSTLACLRVERDSEGHPTRLVFDGGGWGHGLGLCQLGANGRARAGASARRILETYYPGARVVDLRHTIGASTGNR